MKTKFHIIAIFLAISLFSLFAENKDVSQLPKLLGATNEGTEFWFTVPAPFEEPGYDYRDSIRIFVTSSVKTLVFIQVEGKGFIDSLNTVPNDVVMFTLKPEIGQAYKKMANDDEIPEQIYKGAGIHIYATQPIIVYCVVHCKSKYGNISEGWLCIPTSSAGKEYIISGYTVDNNITRYPKAILASICGMVAPYNDTKITLTLAGNSKTITAGGLKSGQTRSIILQKGDIWVVSTKGNGADLSGSNIVSTKPVQVVTCSQCAVIPTGNGKCNYSAEMDLPTSTWGTVLHVPEITKANESSLIRIYSKEADTKIFRDNKQIGHLVSGGGVKDDGFLEMRISSDIQRSAVFSSDKPISITFLNGGRIGNDTPAVYTDPFWMYIQPDEQFQTDITFCTPGLHNRFGFTENHCALIYQADSLKMMPKDMEFGEMTGGVMTFSNFRTKFPGADELFQTINGKTFARKLFLLPSDGVYKIRAKKPFSGYLYGYNKQGSYGFPAATSFYDLDKNDTVPPNAIWTINCDGNVDGLVTDYPDDDANRSNLGSAKIISDSSYNYIFEITQFIPGDIRTASWKLLIIDPAADAKAVIVFSDQRGNNRTIVVNYSAVKLHITESNWNFGTLQVHSEKVNHTFTLVNKSKDKPILISYLKLKKGDSNFQVDLKNISLPILLKPLDSIKFDIIFNPLQIGSFTDSIGFGDTCLFRYIADVKAIVAEADIRVSNVNFGDVDLKDGQQSGEFTIKNAGDADLIITGYTDPIYNCYTTNLPSITKSNPLVLTPGMEKKYALFFTPDKIGSFNDSIAFSSNTTVTDSICFIYGLATPVKENNPDSGTYLNISSNHVTNTLQYSFRLKESGSADFKIIDLKGNIVNAFESFYYSGGEQIGNIITDNLMSGVYFLKLRFKDTILTKKFTITK